MDICSLDRKKCSGLPCMYTAAATKETCTFFPKPEASAAAPVASTETACSANCIHTLRNPYGFTSEEIKAAQLKACDEIERWKGAFENMRDWAKENGMDVMTHNR